ncbi:MAG TPA: hypothetical protein PKY96_16895 [Flavobacteriales bacterium]|nr:hypothetical protein [Flavobacteriales bacterium]
MLPSGLPEEVGDDELVARFARHDSKYFKRPPYRPKYGLFIPPRDSTALSVSRVSGKSEAVIREIGEHVVLQAGDKLYGWATLLVKDVRAIRSLGVVSDEPDDHHHFHAHITGFPLKLPATVPTEKSELIQVCEDLAEAASDMVLVS